MSILNNIAETMPFAGQADRQTNWRSVTQAKLQKVFEDCLVLKTKLEGSEYDYKLLWWDHGAPFDDIAMISKNKALSNVRQSDQVAFTLFPGLAIGEVEDVERKADVVVSFDHPGLKV